LWRRYPQVEDRTGHHTFDHGGDHSLVLWHSQHDGCLRKGSQMSFFPRITRIKTSKPAEEPVPPTEPEPSTAGHQIEPTSESARPQPRPAGSDHPWLRIGTAFPQQPPEQPEQSGPDHPWLRIGTGFPQPSERPDPVRRRPQLFPPWALPVPFRQPPSRWGGSQGSEESGGRAVDTSGSGAADEPGERAGGSRGR
jgi:hypothetical protein